MGNVARIGDKISCGDNIAQGSSNVFANGMPISHVGKRQTTGHGCNPPTVLVGPWTRTVFVNHQPVALKDITQIQPHKCPRARRTHGGVVVTGAATVSFEA